METAFIYCRVSTTDQKNSIKEQEKQLLEYCKNKNIEVKETFIDFGKSGKDTKQRPEFLRMMNLISQGYIPSMVLVTKLDRFARSLVDLHINVSALADRGVKFVTLQQEFDINSPIGGLLFNILGSFAEFERQIINERTREGYRAAKEKGVICNRPRIKIPKKDVLDYLDKGLSASAIAKIYKVKTNTIKNRLNEWGYVYVSPNWVSRGSEDC